MPRTYEPIATTTLGSTANNVNFASISQAYTDLVIVTNFQPNTLSPFRLYVGNGSIDTGNNYSNTQLKGDGTSASSNRASNQGYWNAGYVGSAARCMHTISIMNYTNTTTFKTALLAFSTAVADSEAVIRTAALWRSTSAINTIEFRTNAGELFAVGSTFTLYGIKAA
jgi:hypothetical protein